MLPRPLRSLSLGLLLLGCSSDPSAPSDPSTGGPAGQPGASGTSGHSGSAGSAVAGAAGSAVAGSGGVAGGGAGGGAAGGAAAGISGTSGLSGTSGQSTGGTTGGSGPGGAGSSGASGQGGSSGSGANELPPTEAAALLSYLQAGSYLAFAAESQVHPSTGPHGGTGVRTFVNQALFGSLQAGAKEHPAGAAAVKELYSGGKLSGWAVEVKTQATSDGGAGWYWYEILSTTGSPLIAAQGPNFCASCHASGQDHVLAPFPLQ